jgi:hypothetical protein
MKAEEILLKRLFPSTTRKTLNDANFEYKVNNARHKEILNAMEEYASQQCQKRDEIIKAQDEYIKLLTDELDEVVVLMSVHGWKSHRYEQGKQLRNKIEQLKKEIQ